MNEMIFYILAVYLTIGAFGLAAALNMRHIRRIVTDTVGDYVWLGVLVMWLFYPIALLWLAWLAIRKAGW